MLLSVRKGDRSEGNLQVLNLIRNLSAYTLQKCRSEKVFPKSSRWVMAKPIMDECINALTCVRRANAVYVGEDADAWRYRRNQQVQAHSHLDALLSLIDLAYTSFRIEPKQIEYWTKLAVDADEKLKAWMKADKERYAHLNG